jgi:hypothetical protein
MDYLLAAMDYFEFVGFMLDAQVSVSSKLTGDADAVVGTLGCLKLAGK